MSEPVKRLSSNKNTKDIWKKCPWCIHVTFSKLEIRARSESAALRPHQQQSPHVFDPHWLHWNNDKRMFIGLNQSIQSVMGLNHVSIDCKLSISSFIRVQLIHFWSRSKNKNKKIENKRKMKNRKWFFFTIHSLFHQSSVDPLLKQVQQSGRAWKHFLRRIHRATTICIG